jgi:nucleoside-diphosphate-sugar epimerase
MENDARGAKALVTGGSGYFGLLMVQELRDRGQDVRVLDLNDADDRPAEVELVLGDIRDPATVRRALEGVDVVYHNVAQVPLAKDPEAFESVNVGGMKVLLEACAELDIRKVVATSSSAVFGVPQSNPVTETTSPAPAEAYGRAKLDAELLCHEAAANGLDVSIVRPRTILGHGRLGIFTVLFDWIEAGADVFVLGKGDNRYQFVHARDLADACIRAGARPGAETYNIGARDFGTMREALEALAAHAGTGSKVRSLPIGPTSLAMKVVSKAGLAPFAAYHWIMYSKSMWFDTAKAETELSWTSTASNTDMMIETYDWYIAHKATLGTEERSHHRKPVREGALRAARWVMSVGR